MMAETQVSSSLGTPPSLQVLSGLPTPGTRSHRAFDPVHSYTASKYSHVVQDSILKKSKSIK